MHTTAPAPPGDGAVMWWASALLAAPTISPRIVASRPTACSHSSSTKTAAPSPITKPSRATSKGREMPAVVNAVMLPKPASDVVVAAASVPPVTTASQRPQAINRAAYPIAWVPAAHAVHTVSLGPCNP